MVIIVNKLHRHVSLLSPGSNIQPDFCQTSLLLIYSGKYDHNNGICSDVHFGIYAAPTSSSPLIGLLATPNTTSEILVSLMSEL